MYVKIFSDLKNRFPSLRVLTFSVHNVKVVKRNIELERLKETVFNEVREKYDLATLKDVAIFRAYRDFFWKIGVDPTKNRPASEALIRRVLAGKPIPNINTLVDAYNLASVKSEVALAAFDEDAIKGKLTMRYAQKDETFFGIGPTKPINLKGGEVVISDLEKLLALYPHRDAEYSKVTEETRNVLMLICGVPGICLKTLYISKKIASDYIQRFCNGRI